MILSVYSVGLACIQEEGWKPCTLSLHLTPALSYTEFGECNFLGFSSFMRELRRVWVVLSTIR